MTTNIDRELASRDKLTIEQLDAVSGGWVSCYEDPQSCSYKVPYNDYAMEVWDKLLQQYGF